MTECRQIDEILDTCRRGPTAPLPARAAEHLKECERCRKLVELFETGGPEIEVSPGLRSRIEQALGKTLVPVKPLPPARLFALMFIAVFGLIVLGVAVFQGVPVLRVMTFWQFAAVLAILVAGAVGLGVSLSRQMTPGARIWARPGALVVAVIAGLMLAVALLFPWRLDAAFVGKGLRCSPHGLVFALPSGVVFWLILRCGAMLSPALVGASAGLLAGLVGATVLHFQCTMIGAPHVAVWHMGVPVASALAGFLLGKFAGQRRAATGAHGNSP